MVEEETDSEAFGENKEIGEGEVRAAVHGGYIAEMFVKVCNIGCISGQPMAIGEYIMVATVHGCMCTRGALQAYTMSV